MDVPTSLTQVSMKFQEAHTARNRTPCYGFLRDDCTIFIERYTASYLSPYIRYASPRIQNIARFTGLSATRVIMLTSADTAHKELKASPRNPKLLTERRSSNSDIFDV